MRTSKNQQTFSIGQTAKLIAFPGGRQKFYNWLREKSIIITDRMPSQSMVDKEWFFYPIKKDEQGAILGLPKAPRITIKGLYGLEKIVRKEFPDCPPCNESNVTTQDPL